MNLFGSYSVNPWKGGGGSSRFESKKLGEDFDGRAVRWSGGEEARLREMYQIGPGRGDSEGPRGSEWAVKSKAYNLKLRWKTNRVSHL